MIARDPFSIAAALLNPSKSAARMAWEGLTCPNYPACIEHSRQHPNAWLMPGCTKHARWNQLPPPGDWLTWYIRGGRASGKTRPGAQTLAAWIEDDPPSEELRQYACVAPTFGDARDTMIEGPSGLLRSMGLPRSFPGWNRSQGQLWLDDNSVIFCDGANDGAYRIQGKNLRRLWCDEPGLWAKWEVAWKESIRYAARIGDEGADVRIVITGTPKRGHPFVKYLVEDAHIVKSHLRMRDNIANLSKKVVEDLYREFGGTSLGAQELEGELLDEAEGALWTLDPAIAKAKGKGLIVKGSPPTSTTIVGGTPLQLPDLLRTVVAVDPAMSSSGDEWGIIVICLASDGKIYVRADYSAQCSPEQAAHRIVTAYDDCGGDRIVYEDNQGGELVKLIIDQVRRNLPVSRVRAYQAKQLRAEPVQHAYQQGRVLHWKGVDLSVLEGQMVGWEPLVPGMPSPDRVDALVHGIRELDSANRGKVEQGQSPWQ